MPFLYSTVFYGITCSSFLWYHLQMRKSLLALHQSGQDAAVVINSSTQSFLGMLTVTDVLRAVVVASSSDPKVGDRRVRDFVRVHGKKKLITASVGMR